MSKKFEDIISEKVEKSEFTFDPADWNALEQQLPKGPKPWYQSTLAKSVATVLVVSSISLYYLNTNEKKNSPTDESFKATTHINVNHSTPEDESTIEAVENKNQESVSSIEKSDKKSNAAQTIEIDSIAHNAIKNDPQVANPQLAIEALEEESEVMIDDHTTINADDKSPLKVNIQGAYCQGESVTFISNIEGQHEWKVNGKTIDNSSNELNLEELAYQTYHVEMKSFNQVWDTTFEIKQLSQAVDFIYEDSKDPYFDEAAHLKSTVDLEGQFIWNISGIEGEIVGNPIDIDFGKPGIFDVEMVYIDSNGCEFQMNKPVSIQTDFDPLAPNTYTPNGDGINETFMPIGFDNVEYESFKFYIYNADGQIVYTSMSPDQPWNGRINNTGEELFSEYFVWKVVLQNKSKEKAFTGKAKILSF